MTGRPAIARVAPTFAKMSPTSPRGTMPRPTASRFTPRSRTPSEHACFPTHAAAVKTRASTTIRPSAKDLSSTLSPVSTKKIGTRNVEIGWSSDSMLDSRLSSKFLKWPASRISPAANAPTMGESPTKVPR